MFDAERESTDSEHGSAPAEDGPSSNADAARDAGASLRSAVGYRSLRTRDDFTRVFEHGRRHRRGDIVVLFVRGECAPEVGIVASRRRVGGAVQRNRAKRRIRAALARIPLPAGKYVVIAGRAVLDAKFERLVSRLEEAVREVTDG